MEKLCGIDAVPEEPAQEMVRQYPALTPELLRQVGAILDPPIPPEDWERGISRVDADRVILVLRNLDLLPPIPQRDWEQVAPPPPYGAPPSYNEGLLRVETQSDTEEDWDAVEEHSSSLHDSDVEARSVAEVGSEVIGEQSPFLSCSDVV